MERKNRYRSVIAAIVLYGLASSCNQGGLSFLRPADYPHQAYENKLKDAGLGRYQLARQWNAAAERSLASAVQEKIPFSINGIFGPHTVEAQSWRFFLQRGSTVHIEAEWASPDSSRLFLDVFTLDNGRWEHIMSAKEDRLTLEFEAKETADYTIRVQPELLASGQYTLRARQVNTYAVFPVWGKNSSAVQSFWGAARDGGRRSHEGIDIFASRGTPVVSPVKGIVSSVRNGGLGGKSVFVKDGGRGHSLYFAHLDSQYVNAGNFLNPGDTIGEVGNTGNAKYTSPHLHFGIYTGLPGP